MTTFVRTMTANYATFPQFPKGLESWGHSGKGQFRDIQNVGRVWDEGYPPIKYNNENHRAFIAQINKFWRERTIFTIVHPSLETPLGTISGNLYFYAPSGEQTGSTIQVSSSTSSQVAFAGSLKAGDIIKIAGSNIVYDITETATGATSLKISPPLYTGNGIADDAMITYTGVPFRAVLSGQIKMPSAGKAHVYSGLSLSFREAP